MKIFEINRDSIICFSCNRTFNVSCASNFLNAIKTEKRKIMILSLRTVLFSLFFLCNLTSYAENYPLDLVIILDNGNEFKDQMRGGFGLTMPFDLQNAIDSNVPFLTNSTVLLNLKNAGIFDSTFKKLITGDWVLYKNKTEEYLIGLPKNYWPLDAKDSNNLFNIGLNEDVLQQINPSFLVDTLNQKEQKFNEQLQKDPQVIFEPFELEHLKKILINPDARKRMFITGHGFFAGILLEEKLKEQAAQVKAIIAGMPVAAFQNFLEFLNTMGTDFLYVSSCYGGGYNLVQGYQKQNDEMAIKPLKLGYFVVVGALTDESTRGGTLKFKEFFHAINNLFSPKTTLKNPFEEILKPVSSRFIQNLPSIRYPGSLNYFKVIDVDKKTEIITYALVTAKSIEKKPIIIKNKEAILLYPIEVAVPLKITEMIKEPLKIGGVVIPALVSMIPGNAFHVLQEMAINAPIDRLIKEMFFFFAIPSEKIFLMQTLSASNYVDSGLPKAEMHNVMIQKKPMKWGGIVLGNIDDQFYKADISYDRTTGIQPIMFTKIDNDPAHSILRNAISQIKIDPRAVIQASGGREDLESVRAKILKNFLK